MGNTLSNEELVSEIQAGRNSNDNIVTLYKQNFGLLRKVAKRYAHNREDIEDALQEAFLGLYRAAITFEPGKGATFGSYAAFVIARTIKRYFDNTGRASRVPVYMLQIIGEYNREVKSFQARFGRMPTVKEVAGLLGTTHDKANEIIKAAKTTAAAAISLDAPLSRENENTITLAELLEAADDTETEVIERIAQQELARELWNLAAELDESGLDVIGKRWRDGLSVARIAMATGQTTEHVKAAEKAAMRKLRNPRNQKRLISYLPEWLQIYRRTGLRAFKEYGESSVERDAIRLCLPGHEREGG